MPGKGRPFEKGNPGKPKGARNGKTEQWEKFSEYCLNGGLERFEQELNSLKGEKYVNAFVSLLEFHKPKLARTQTELEVANNTLEIVKTIVNAPVKS